MREQLKALLDDTRKILRLYGMGAILFFIGVGTIQGADKLLPPSLQQEVYVLVGMVIGGSGFAVAMFAQILLIVQRFRQMGKH